VGAIIYLSRYIKRLQKKQTLPKVGYQCRDCHDYSKADYVAFTDKNGKHVCVGCANDEEKEQYEDHWGYFF